MPTVSVACKPHFKSNFFHVQNCYLHLWKGDWKNRSGNCEEEGGRKLGLTEGREKLKIGNQEGRSEISTKLNFTPCYEQTHCMHTHLRKVWSKCHDCVCNNNIVIDCFDSNLVGFQLVVASTLLPFQFTSLFSLIPTVLKYRYTIHIASKDQQSNIWLIKLLDVF